MKGNKVDLLIDGLATFDSIVDGIDQAREYILFQFFIIHNDELGQRIKTHLVARAKQGGAFFSLYEGVSA